MTEAISTQNVQNRIYRIRGQSVMLSHDLARLYGVKPKVLMQAVKRNNERFPSDFMFQLSDLELKIYLNPRSQFVTLKPGYNIKYRPYAFTEQGIAMLSSVLRSRKAIQVNIAIMRAFVKLRHALFQNRDLSRRIEQVEGRIELVETDVRLILQDVRDLKNPAQLQLPHKPHPHVKGFNKD